LHKYQCNAKQQYYVFVDSVLNANHRPWAEHGLSNFEVYTLMK